MAYETQLARIRQRVTQGPQDFRLYSVISPVAVEAIEAEYNINLPSDYRQFLLEVGNGGEINGWPLYSLTKALTSIEGLASVSFPYTGDRALDENIERSLTYGEGDPPMLGALTLYYYGCTHSDLLVVSGPQSGTIWYDGRGIGFGFLPYTHRFSHPMGNPLFNPGINPESSQHRNTEDKQIGFLDWYERHLDRAEQSAT